MLCCSDNETNKPARAKNTPGQPPAHNFDACRVLRRCWCVPCWTTRPLLLRGCEQSGQGCTSEDKLHACCGFKCIDLLFVLQQPARRGAQLIRRGIIKWISYDLADIAMAADLIWTKLVSSQRRSGLIIKAESSPLHFPLHFHRLKLISSRIPQHRLKRLPSNTTFATCTYPHVECNSTSSLSPPCWP